MLNPNFRIAEVVAEYKRKWTNLIEEGKLEELCKAQGCRWRERVLTPVRTIQLFLLQILHGNTACAHLRHLSGLNFSGMAYCKARQRLPLRVLALLVKRIASHLPTEEVDETRWHGHRVWLGDGSGCSMPDTDELRTSFGHPSGQRPGCGFPVAHLLVLMHAGTGMIQKLVVSPFRTHDLSRVVELHPEFEAGDVVVKDRGFCSFAHLGLLGQRHVHAVFRVHQKQKVNFRAGRPQAKPQESGLPTSRWVKKLGRTDHLVQWQKPRKPPVWLSAEQFARLPHTLLVRELRYHLDQQGFRTTRVTLVTTLLDPKRYSKAALADLYGLRWTSETNLRHLKITMGMDILRCKTVDGVLKELHVFCVVYNLVRLVMLEGAKKQNVPLSRISFVDALRSLQVARLQKPFPSLIVNPCRPGRLEPRVRKRRPKAYKLMTTPRKSSIGKPSPQHSLAA